MEVRYYCGIDPGNSGSIVLLATDSSFILAQPLSDTEVDIIDFVQEHASAIDLAVLESVHAMPKQGVCSSFTFGQGVGFLRGVLLSAKIPLHTVTPQRWMKSLQCMTKGDKNVTKARAQELFPNEKITHKVADAMLIAYWAKHFLHKEVNSVACKKEGKRHESMEKSSKKGGKKKK